MIRHEDPRTWGSLPLTFASFSSSKLAQASPNHRSAHNLSKSKSPAPLADDIRRAHHMPTAVLSPSLPNHEAALKSFRSWPGVFLWLVLVLSVPCSAFARAKKDVLVMKNGDRITCEIKELAQGQ